MIFSWVCLLLLWIEVIELHMMTEEAMEMDDGHGQRTRVRVVVSRPQYVVVQFGFLTEDQELAVTLDSWLTDKKLMVESAADKCLAVTSHVCKA